MLIASAVDNQVRTLFTPVKDESYMV